MIKIIIKYIGILFILSLFFIIVAILIGQVFLFLNYIIFKWGQKWTSEDFLIIYKQISPIKNFHTEHMYIAIILLFVLVFIFKKRYLKFKNIIHISTELFIILIIIYLTINIIYPFNYLYIRKDNFQINKTIYKYEDIQKVVIDLRKAKSKSNTYSNIEGHIYTNSENSPYKFGLSSEIFKSHYTKGLDEKCILIFIKCENLKEYKVQKADNFIYVIEEVYKRQIPIEVKRNIFRKKLYFKNKEENIVIDYLEKKNLSIKTQEIESKSK